MGRATNLKVKQQRSRRKHQLEHVATHLSLFSSAWYTRSQESGTFWLLQGRLLLLLMLDLRVKLLLRTDSLLLATLLLGALFPETRLVNCLRGAPRDMKESILTGSRLGCFCVGLLRSQTNVGVDALLWFTTGMRLQSENTKNKSCFISTFQIMIKKNNLILTLNSALLPPPRSYLFVCWFVWI